MGFLGTLLGSVATSLIGGLFSSSATNDTNQMNMDMMKQQEAYNTTMSNSAYTRASADMKNAGLNPMIMAGSGGPAATPGISVPSMTSPQTGIASAIQGVLSTAIQAKTADASIKQLNAQTVKTNADAVNTGADTVNKLHQTGLIDAQAASAKAQKLVSEASAANINQSTDYGAPVLRNKAKTAENQLDMNPTFRKLLDQGGFAGQSVSDAISPVNSLVSTAKNLF